MTEQIDGDLELFRATRCPAGYRWRRTVLDTEVAGRLESLSLEPLTDEAGIPALQGGE